MDRAAAQALTGLAAGAALALGPLVVPRAVADLRRLRHLLDLLAAEGVDTRGEPMVLVSRRTLGGLEETIEVLSDPELLDDLRASAEDIAAGRVSDGEEMLARLRRQYAQQTA